MAGLVPAMSGGTVPRQQLDAVAVRVMDMDAVYHAVFDARQLPSGILRSFETGRF
jgi:hypothetical protein